MFFKVEYPQPSPNLSVRRLESSMCIRDRPRSYVSWVHTELNLVDYNLKQCLFGEHLLSDNPAKPIAIVELSLIHI